MIPIYHYFPNNRLTESDVWIVFVFVPIGPTTREELKGDDSPNTLEKDTDSEHYGGSDISSLSGGIQKPLLSLCVVNFGLLIPIPFPRSLLVTIKNLKLQSFPYLT